MKSKTRTENTILNVSSNFIVYIIKTLCTFSTRTIFIYCLGKEALGLNGLFTNVLSMLSLAELGVGTAINFSLYDPISKRDNKRISSLMTFYKKVYKTIGIIVFVLGIILIPFLRFLIKDINTINHIYIIYFLFLLNTSTSYLISYKETLIIADQKKYLLTKIETLFLIILNILQITFLVIYKNYIIYLLIQLLVQFFQKVVTNLYITKKYKNINFNSKKQINKKDWQEIKINVKAMFFHKIGDYCINGTDNLIISSFINISTVGLYSNYLIIVTLINSAIIMIYNNLASSLGNLIATETYEKRHLVFKKMVFIGFILYGCSFIVLLNSFNDFISVWVGKEYCLNFWIVLCLLINFYLTGMRVPCSTTKMAAGIYDADKYTPLIQSVINLIISIILVQKIGILGVIIGTIVSSISLPSWQRPIIVYKYVLKSSPKKYFINYLENIFILTLVSLITIVLFKVIIINNIILRLIIKILISILLFLIAIYIFYKNSDEYKYILNMIKKILGRIKHEK